MKTTINSHFDHSTRIFICFIFSPFFLSGKRCRNFFLFNIIFRSKWTFFHKLTVRKSALIILELSIKFATWRWNSAWEVIMKVFNADAGMLPCFEWVKVKNFFRKKSDSLLLLLNAFECLTSKHFTPPTEKKKWNKLLWHCLNKNKNKTKRFDR